MKACIEAGTHHLDISGEPQVSFPCLNCSRELSVLPDATNIKSKYKNNITVTQGFIYKYSNLLLHGSRSSA